METVDQPQVSGIFCRYSSAGSILSHTPCEMRPIIPSGLFLGLVCTLSNAQAQTGTTTELPTYLFQASVPVIQCNFDGTPVAGATEVPAPVRSQFAYLGQQSIPASGGRPARTVVVLQFLLWDPQRNPTEYRTFNVSPSAPASQLKTYCVDEIAFQRTATRTYDSGWSSWDLAAGVLLLPIKMRLGGEGREFDFSRDVTLGTVVGPRWRISPTREAYWSLLGGAGITAVSLDPESTGGAVQQATDRAAVTLTVGTMMEINRFQVGVLLGWDRISNPNQNDWKYQGATWLSVGLGYSLLSDPPRSPARGQ